MEERKKYPIGPESYDLLEEIGQGVSASVYRALCVPINETVAIKILDFERDNCDLSNISREAQTMILVDHPNVVKAHCSFVSGHNLWVVMPFMAGGSCLHILKAAYPDGFSEVVISTILREVLKGLEYLHHHGRIHRDVKAGNILLDARGTVKLGDFGVSACLFDSGDRQRTRNTFVGTPCWMAPEVMEQLHGYDFKADIWSFGITALELAHGHAPFSKYPPMKVLLMTLQNAPPGLDYERDRKFSKSFKQMVAMCLVKDPSKRPSAHKLLKHSFFKQARPNEYIARTILEGLPTLGDRIRALKIKEEDMLAQKKMPDGRKEELSQDEYKRGISGWNFNIEDLKTQAALIQDGEEVISDKYRVGSSNALYELDQMNQYDAADKEDDDAVQNNPASLSLADLTEEYLKGRCDRSEDESSIAGSTNEHNASQDGLHLQGDRIGNNFTERPEQEIKERQLEGSDKQPNQGLNIISCNEVALPTAVDDAVSEPVNRTLKSSASNGEDYDEKGKVSVVQQKGRFKVTSENVNLDKASPCPSPSPTPMLQKSHSMQVITQLPAVSLQPSSDATSSNTSGSSFLPELHSMLRANISQRDSILYLMKQLSNGNFKALCPTDGSSGSLPTITEKSLLELAHDKEKDLLHEVTELQWRLISTQEELQRYKMKNSQFQI